MFLFLIYISCTLCWISYGLSRPMRKCLFWLILLRKKGASSDRSQRTNGSLSVSSTKRYECFRLFVQVPPRYKYWLKLNYNPTGVGNSQGCRWRYNYSGRQYLWGKESYTDFKRNGYFHWYCRNPLQPCVPGLQLMSGSYINDGLFSKHIHLFSSLLEWPAYIQPFTFPQRLASWRLCSF